MIESIQEYQVEDVDSAKHLLTILFATRALHLDGIASAASHTLCRFIHTPAIQQVLIDSPLLYALPLSLLRPSLQFLRQLPMMTFIEEMNETHQQLQEWITSQFEDVESDDEDLDSTKQIKTIVATMEDTIQQHQTRFDELVTDGKTTKPSSVHIRELEHNINKRDESIRQLKHEMKSCNTPIENLGSSNTMMMVLIALLVVIIFALSAWLWLSLSKHSDMDCKLNLEL
jgi:hypothetical protein